jgi:hypothetical protein
MKPAPLLLLVPFALVSVAFAAIAQQQSSSVRKWQQSQKTDAVRGTPYARFTLMGKFLRSPSEASNDPALAVDCVPSKVSHKAEGKFVAGNLIVGVSLKIDYVEPEEIHGTSYYQKVSVRYRFDDGKEEGEKWTPGTDKTSASFSKDLLEKILRAHTVEITAQDAGGSQVVMQFEMPDPAPVEEACDVDVHKK